MRILLPISQTGLCFLLCLSALWPTNVFAQGQTYYLSLNGQNLTVPDRKVYVEQVVDGRVGKPAIGAVYRGLENRNAGVLFKQGLEPEMTTLVQRLPKRATDHVVVLCVRQMHVSEEILNGFTELASADLAADVYVQMPDGYHFVRKVADRTSTRAMETTALHARHVARLLETCLSQLVDANWEQAAKRPARQLDQLVSDKPLMSARPAILGAVAPSRGLYRSFEDFINNRPDTKAVLDIATLHSTGNGWEGTVLPMLRVHDAAGKRIPVKEVWGFSDGHRAYVRHRSTYRTLTQQSGFYTYVGPAPLDVAAAKQRAEAYGAMGMFGALTTGGEDHTGKPIVYSLDLSTGQVGPFLSASQSQRPDTAFVYVYRPLGGSPEAQRLLLDDREVGQLRPGEYVELAWPYFGRVLRLSVGTPGGPAVLAAPSSSTANYVKLVSGSATSPWQWMPVRQGEAEVDALDKQRK